MTNVLSTAQSLDNYKVSLGDYIGVCTGPPGSTSTVLNEAVYTSGTRQATTWTPGTNGSNAGSVVNLHLPAGTYPYGIICSGATGNNMIDWFILPNPIVIGSAAVVPVTPSSSTT